MNQNRGQVIYLRLRYPGDANQFLPIEQVTDTMLHELSHHVYSDHDEKFNALWDELRNEHEGLVSKGYTGEGFLSEGNRLGGRRIPKEEARRIRRIAAEKRALSKGSGQKLGGAAVPLGSDMRKVIADAIERRSTIIKGCGSGGNKNTKEIEAIGDQASKNGFRTKAEEEEANEAAIAQALWELHQEDEKQKYGSAYVLPTMAGSSGSYQGSSTQLKTKVPTPRIPDSKSPLSASYGIEAAIRPVPESSKSRVQPPRNSSRLVPPLPAKRPAPSSSPPKTKPDASIIREGSSASKVKPNAVIKKEETPAPTKFWTCPTCTFAGNPVLHLCCDICMAEQPASVTQSLIKSSSTHAAKKDSSNATSAPVVKTWLCNFCGNTMDSQWWTCSTCGTLKQSSKV